jgi:hypothetical protein
MNERENPNGVAVYLIYQPVAAVRREFARSGNFGNHVEVFKLDDASLWQVQNEYEYLCEYQPEVVICPSQGSEPSRDCRRPYLLRERVYDEQDDKQVCA